MFLVTPPKTLNSRSNCFSLTTQSLLIGEGRTSTGVHGVSKHNTDMQNVSSVIPKHSKLVVVCLLITLSLSAVETFYRIVDRRIVLLLRCILLGDPVLVLILRVEPTHFLKALYLGYLLALTDICPFLGGT